MADLFQCDHCGDVKPITEKKGRIILEEIRWEGAVKFPPLKLYEHDLCGACLATFKAPRLRRAAAREVKREAPALEEPKPPVIDIKPEGEKG